MENKFSSAYISVKKCVITSRDIDEIQELRRQVADLSDETGVITPACTKIKKQMEETSLSPAVASQCGLMITLIAVDAKRIKSTERGAPRSTEYLSQTRILPGFFVEQAIRSASLR